MAYGKQDGVYIDTHKNTHVQLEQLRFHSNNITAATTIEYSFNA